MAELLAPELQVPSALRGIVARRCTPDVTAWLDDALAQAADPARFAAAFAGAGRRLGTALIEREDASRVTAAGLAWPEAAGVDECGRGALVIAAIAALPEDAQVPVVRDLLRRGEVRERQAVLRVLAVLPAPVRFVDSAVDACRTNIQTVFEAIACDNAFPARHFPALAFDQMVLKALSNGAPVGRIVGLAERTTGELVRMVDAFASERRAAGRDIPADVTLVRRPS
jgi:hypothetical protein